MLFTLCLSAVAWNGLLLWQYKLLSEVHLISFVKNPSQLVHFLDVYKQIYVYIFMHTTQYT